MRFNGKKINQTKLLFTGLCIFLSCSGQGRLKGPPPNILLIVMDAARADAFSCYGYARNTTPNLDILAAEGLMFSQAVSSTSWTVPSHASLFTGLQPYEHGATNQHYWLVDHIPTLAELLKNHGYLTAGFSNNPLVSSSQNLDRGFDVFENIWADTTAVSPAKPYNTEKTNELLRAYIDKNAGKNKPFFIFINYMDTHQPYYPPEPYRSLYLPSDQSITARIDSAIFHSNLLNEKRLLLTEDEISITRALYDGALNYLDKKIAELLDYLKQKGLYDMTLVIVTSDHGEVFGEKGHFGHREFLFRSLIQIPLLVRYPALINQPAVIDQPVAIADIFHTITTLLGIEVTEPSGVSPRYLLDKKFEAKPCYSMWKTGRTWDTVSVIQPDFRSLWTPENLHYILSEGYSY